PDPAARQRSRGETPTAVLLRRTRGRSFPGRAWLPASPRWGAVGGPAGGLHLSAAWRSLHGDPWLCVPPSRVVCLCRGTRQHFPGLELHERLSHHGLETTVPVGEHERGGEGLLVKPLRGTWGMIAPLSSRPSIFLAHVQPSRGRCNAGAFCHNPGMDT